MREEGKERRRRGLDGVSTQGDAGTRYFCVRFTWCAVSWLAGWLQQRLQDNRRGIRVRHQEGVNDEGSLWMERCRCGDAVEV